MFATDNCKDCVSRCMHAGKDREFVCPGGVSCKITKKRGMTNGDRIRAMSDEELAWELMTWRLDAVARNHGIEGVYPDTQKEILKWLHQPAKEDT